ncbi:MAG: double zinc ribbon domain-containing protein [Syntrophorhabdales bacterium]
MKICRRCGEEFEEADNQHDPTAEPDAIFVESMSGSRSDEFCPECRKELELTTKTCRRCGEEFEEGDNEHDLVTELGDMFVESMSGSRPDELCPKCRKDVAVTTLLGFDL